MAPRAPHRPCMHCLLPGPFSGVQLKEGSTSVVILKTYYQQPHFTHSGPNQQEVPTMSLHWRLPSFWGVIDGSRVAFFFCQESTNNSTPGGKGPAPRWPLAESPGSSTNVTEAAEKGKTARPMGPQSRSKICYL